MIGVSRSELYTAIVVGIGMYFLFDHFHLISSSYAVGRLEAKAAFLFGGGTVLLVWPLIFKKKNNSSGSS
jgi:hypothetical protein